jgi:hypothetical protein
MAKQLPTISFRIISSGSFEGRPMPLKILGATEDMLHTRTGLLY